MEYTEIARPVWKTFFDYVSKQTRDLDMELRISSSEIGDQLESDWVRGEGISYDPRDDVIRLYTRLLEHAINKPREVLLGGFGPVIQSIGITDGANQVQVIRFRSPLMLGNHIT